MQDDPIYIVTGMHRSGTSALAGLLNRCGFALGSERELLQATAHNVKGHFENMSALQINDALLAMAGGSWGTLPSQEQIAAASQQSADAMRNFCRSFSGNLVKDPRFSLTLPMWHQYCPRIAAVIYCFRHPRAVALSLQKRSGFTLAKGLNLWREYNLRLVAALNQIQLPAVLVDYDHLSRHLESDLHGLLGLLGVDLAMDEMQRRIEGFFEPDLNHNPAEKFASHPLPEQVAEVYEALQARSGM